MSVEVWKDINEFKDLYMVSNMGRVRSLYTDKILKQKISNSGYRQVCLCKNKKKHSRNVHRLVAKAFHENPYGLPVVNHKDELRDNNRADNLEWCTQKYNVNYGEGRKARETKVVQLNDKGELIKSWDSMKDAEKATGVKYQNISRCCRKGRRSAGGYVWRYESEQKSGENYRFCKR